MSLFVSLTVPRRIPCCHVYNYVYMFIWFYLVRPLFCGVSVGGGIWWGFRSFLVIGCSDIFYHLYWGPYTAGRRVHIRAALKALRPPLYAYHISTCIYVVLKILMIVYCGSPVSFGYISTIFLSLSASLSVCLSLYVSLCPSVRLSGDTFGVLGGSGCGLRQ